MQQLAAVWSNLDPRRRIVAGLAALAVFVTLVAMSRMAAAPSLALLYSGLQGGTAGEVVQALEQRAVAYEVRGDAIFVDSRQRDALRMTLAGEGLPANGAAGYELLDSLTGFGTTSQMFDAAYWRAKEGELARTIVASPHIRAARVHIASTSGQPFRRDLKPSASVTVTTTGDALTARQAKALKYLVAASVAGLAPADVSVIDGQGGLVVGGDDDGVSGLGGGDRAAALRRNVERLLEARMGPGKAVVEVTVETVTDRESIVERRFDPEERVAISTETEERTRSANDRNGTAVTVASNLPAGDAAADRSSASSDAETRERVNFEVSETTREVLRAPGAVKRLTVAVMLDGVRRIDESGAEIWEPLPDPELNALEELVASAVGFDAARGDVITVKSMPLEPPAPAGTLVEAGWLDRLNVDVMSVAQITVLGLVTLLLGVFVLRPILTGRARAPLATLPSPPASGSAPGVEAPSGLTGEIDEGPLPEAGAIDAGAEPAALALPPADPVDRLRQLITDRRDESIEILRNWMEDEEERA